MRPPSDGSDSKAGQGGFTLLEVLIAFIIAALALGVMFDGVLGGMRAAAVAGHTEQALIMARSRLDAARVAIDTGAVGTVMDQNGDDGDGFHYAVRVRPAAQVAVPRGDETGLPGQPVGPAPKATLYAIGVTVSWKTDGGNRQVHLDGARLTMALPPSS